MRQRNSRAPQPGKLFDTHYAVAIPGYLFSGDYRTDWNVSGIHSYLHHAGAHRERINPYGCHHDLASNRNGQVWVCICARRHIVYLDHLVNDLAVFVIQPSQGVWGITMQSSPNFEGAYGRYTIFDHSDPSVSYPICVYGSCFLYVVG